MSDGRRPVLFVEDVSQISEVIAACVIVIGDYAMEGEMRRRLKITYGDFTPTEVLAVLEQFIDIKPFNEGDV